MSAMTGMGGLAGSASVVVVTRMVPNPMEQRPPRTHMHDRRMHAFRDRDQEEASGDQVNQIEADVHRLKPGAVSQFAMDGGWGGVARGRRNASEAMPVAPLEDVAHCSTPGGGGYGRLVWPLGDIAHGRRAKGVGRRVVGGLMYPLRVWLLCLIAVSQESAMVAAHRASTLGVGTRVV